MTDTLPPTVRCPACAQPITPSETVLNTRCALCGWAGQVLVFNPPAPKAVDQPAPAMGDDTTCVHHPTKRAEAVCSGTGDYICSLCAIDVQGKTYSAAYLNRTEKTDLSEQFNRTLARPDRVILLLALLSIFPWTAIAGPAFLIFAFFQFAKLRRQRRESSLYRRLTDGNQQLAIILLLGLWIGLYVAAAALITIGVVA